MYNNLILFFLSQLCALFQFNNKILINARILFVVRTRSSVVFTRFDELFCLSFIRYALVIPFVF